MATTDMKEARVGIGVLLVRKNDKKVLVGKRKGKLGNGEWALPGGHLEYKESFEECAARETLEETGIHVDTTHLSVASAVNSVFHDSGKHYVTVFMRAEVPENTTAENTEPDKCEGWEWHSLDQIPKPQFLPLQLLITNNNFTL